MKRRKGQFFLLALLAKPRSSMVKNNMGWAR
jgi:hypothetical protein